MSNPRRHFIKTASVLASGFAFASAAGAVAGCGNTSNSAAGNKFGIQLYTLRDVLPKDVRNTLQQLASFGYKQIESYEGEQGMFWGMKNTEFKSFLNGLGMELVASHCEYTKDLERKADEAAAIGMKYLICPYIGPQPNLDAFKKFADSFNKAGAICEERGIRFAYHNHDYSFKKLEGQYPQDVMMAITDKDLVDYEMDMYWVVTAGEDPVAWFKKHPNRFTLGHVKDRDRKANKTTTLGTGVIDYASVLKEAARQGMEYFIVEQEEYEGTTPVAAAKADAEYMQKLKV